MSDLFPGWYPDPEVEDQDRWWNGIGWADRVLPKGHTEVQISPLSEARMAPNTPPATGLDETPPHATRSDQTDSTVQPDPAVQPDDDDTATHNDVVDLRSDDRTLGPTDSPDADDRPSRRDLPTEPVSETYIAWDGLAYEGQPPEGWHLASDDRWWGPGTGPDTGPDAESSTEDEPAPVIDPAATVIAPPKPRIESDTSSFSLPATSYSRLEKLPSAQDTSHIGPKKSSWWKRRKS